MATDDSTETPAADISPEEARRRLLRLIARQDMDEHADVYRDLERE